MLAGSVPSVSNFSLPFSADSPALCSVVSGSLSPFHPSPLSPRSLVSRWKSVSCSLCFRWRYLGLDLPSEFLFLCFAYCLREFFPFPPILAFILQPIHEPHRFYAFPSSFSVFSCLRSTLPVPVPITCYAAAPDRLNVVDLLPPLSSLPLGLSVS